MISASPRASFGRWQRDFFQPGDRRLWNEAQCAIWCRRLVRDDTRPITSRSHSSAQDCTGHTVPAL